MTCRIILGVALRSCKNINYYIGEWKSRSLALWPKFCLLELIDLSNAFENLREQIGRDVNVASRYQQSIERLSFYEVLE